MLCRQLTAIPRDPFVPQNERCKDADKCSRQLVHVATLDIQSRRVLREDRRSLFVSEAPRVPRAAWIHRWHRSDGVRSKRSSRTGCVWVQSGSDRPAELLQLTSWLSHQRPHVTEETQSWFALIYKCHLLQVERGAWEQQSWTDLFWHQDCNVARYTYDCHIQI